MNPQLLGSICVVGAMLVFIVNDVSIKYLSADYPIHELVLGRTLVALCITLIITRFDGGLAGLRTRRPFLQMARGLLIVVANLTYFLALAVMPLADNMAIFFTGPLIITVLSAVLLKESVGVRRWTGVTVGLVGMLFIVQPTSDSFQMVALLPLAAAVCYASMQILTRIISATERATALAFYIQLTFLVVSTTLGLTIGDGRFSGSDDATLEFLTRAWVWPQPEHLVFIIASGLAVGIGAYLLSMGYKIAEASHVAPFEYAALPWGVAAGYLVWGDIPTAATVVGILLIVGSGVYVLKRSQLKREAGTAG